MYSNKIIQIVFIYYRNQLVECTIGWALREIAKKYKLKYKEVYFKPNEYQFNQIKNIRNSLIFVIFDPCRPLEEFESLKNNNVKIIQFGGDNHYFKNSVKNFAGIDLHIDTMFQMEQLVAGKVKNFAHYYWSISQKFIDLIKTQPEKQDNEKEYDIICLCTSNTKFRRKFFSKLKQKYKVLVDLQEYDLNKVIGHYHNSIITLGTSSSCTDYWKEPSMKGFRDWIGPFCNSVLIYDRIEEMYPLEGTVPFYHNEESLFKLIDDLKADKNRRYYCIKKQREWALNNTVDKQLERILRSLNFIQEKKEEIWNPIEFVSSWLLKTDRFKPNFF